MNDEREQQLVAAFLAGDNLAFGELTRMLTTPLYHLCYKHVRDEDDAKDVVQETLIKVWTRKEQFRPDSNFRAWVYRIAANGCIDRIRRRKTRAASELDDRISADSLAESDLPAIGSYGRATPMQQTARQRLGERLAKAIDTLPESHRQCVILAEIEELPYQEIAEMLGIPKGTVMSRLFYARRKLQLELADYAEEARHG